MPLQDLTPEQREYIISKGENPDDYKLDASLLSSPSAISNSPGALGAGVRSFGAGALPSAAGGLGFAAGANPALPWNAAAIGAAPETFGTSLLVPLISGGIAAYGSGRLAGAGQNAILPQSIKEQLAKDEQEHPTASTIGRLADIPLGGLNFSPTTTLRAVGSIPKALLGAPLTAAEKQAAGQVGVGTALGGVQTAVQEKMEGKDLSPKEILEGALTGGVFNKPNALGKKYGFPGQNNDPDLLSQKKLLSDIKSGNPQGVGTEGAPLPKTTQKVGNDVPVDSVSTITGLPTSAGSTLRKRIPYLEGDIGGEVEHNAMEAEGGMVPKEPITPEEQRLIDFWRARQELERKQEPAPKANNPKAISRNTLEITKNKFLNSEISRDEFRPSSEGKELPSVTSDESASDLEFRKIEGLKDKYQKTTSGKTPLGEEVGKSLEDNTLPSNPTKEWFTRLQKWGADVRGVKVGEDETITTPSGESVNGVQFVKDGIKQVLVNPKTSSIDTLPHELYHAFIGDMENSRRPEDRALVQKLYVLSKPGLDSYNSQPGVTPIDVHEFATSEQGLEFLKQQLNLNGEKGIQKWWNDVKSIWKSKLSKDTDVSQIRRFLNYRFVNDRATPLSSSISSVVTNVPQKEQPTSQLKGAKDTEYLPPKFIGHQDDFSGKTKGFDLYNLQSPVYDKEGKILHNKGSTVSEGTLLKYGIEVPKKEQGELLPSKEVKAASEFAKMREEVNKSKYQEDSQLDKGKIDRSNEYSEHFTTRTLYNVLKMRPALDQLKLEGGDEGAKVADSISSYYGDKDQMFGKYFSPVYRAASGLPESSVNRVEQILIRENADGQNYRNNLNGKEARLYDTVRQSLLQKQQDQIKAGQKVTDWDQNGKVFTRDAQINPTYYPNKMSTRVIETLTEQPHSSGAKSLKKDFLDYQLKQGNTPEQSKEKLKGILSSFDKTDHTNNTRFNAVRMTEGVGLPESWMKKGLLKNLSSYYGRVSSDRAFYDNIESKPEIGELLNPENEEGVAHAAKDIIEHIKGEPFDKDEAQIKAANRIATSLMLGPLTNIHIGMSSLANSLQYLKPAEVPGAYTHAITGMQQWYQKALENGYLRKDLNSVRDLMDASSTTVEKMRSAASVISRLNGRQLTDTLTKSFLHGMGDFVIKVRQVEARNGDKQAVEMLRRLDPSWSVDKKYTPEEQDALASTFAGYIHGNHDARTLPGWMQKDTVVQPFFSLMSWSVAQTGAWMKNVWEPALKGNMTPLVMSTLGAAVGGYVIQQMREAVSDKKTAIPSLQEIANSSGGLAGNKALLAYNFMQMASFTGWAGITSMLAKDAFDMAYKNMPSVSTFPLDESISQSAHSATEAISALMQSPSLESFMQIAPRVVADIAKENIQGARIAMSWAAKEGLATENQQYQKKVNTASGDLRRYKMVEGQPYDQQTESENNPYLNIPQKNFKREGNLGESVHDIPQLLLIAQERANGNPEVLRQQLRGLKQNSYQTMPSMENNPLQFSQYMQYLTRAFGPEIAQQRMQDYIHQVMLNRAKSSLVPSF